MRKRLYHLLNVFSETHRLPKWLDDLVFDACMFLHSPAEYWDDLKRRHRWGEYR